MNEDLRKPFADAVAAFKQFAVEQGRPTDLVWMSQDRVCVKRGSVWIFRPNELKDDDPASVFYEVVRRSNSSLKLFAIGELDGLLVAGVEELPSPPHDPNQLYMTLSEDPRYAIRPVTNRMFWTALSLFPTSTRDRLISEAIALTHIAPMANKSWVASR